MVDIERVPNDESRGNWTYYQRKRRRQEICPQRQGAAKQPITSLLTNAVGANRYIGNWKENVCSHCGALRFPLETVTICCNSGSIDLPRFPQLPEEIRELWTSDSNRAKLFRKYSRFLNNSLALASHKFTDPSPETSNFRPTLFIQGKSYHCFSSLQASNAAPRFAQLYVHDPQADELRLRLDNLRLPSHVSPTDRSELSSVVASLQTILRDSNPYIRDFMQIREIPDSDVRGMRFIVDPGKKPANEHSRRYNMNLSEVSVVTTDHSCPREIVVRKRGGGVVIICDNHRSKDPLHFILFFPFGTDGWHTDLKQTNNPSRRVTSREYYCFHMHKRLREENILHRGERLFQEYICMGWATTESQQLYFIAQNQKHLRAELYNNLHDALSDTNEGIERVGVAKILPASFVGSPRDRLCRYLDGMAVCRKFHKPDLFLTFTCNPKWKEIQECLEVGQSAEDRPDIVARVFKQKLDCFHEDLKRAFGTMQAIMSVVEFQKRGLPHAHVLLILEGSDRPSLTSEIDNIISAEIPSSEDATSQPGRRLRQSVLTHMIHGPCGSQNPKAPCMKDGRCSKGFPKLFSNHTAVRDSLMYPLYRRRSPSNGGASLVVGDKVVDNSWVVPYNPYLLQAYECHLNVEVCVSPTAAKYLYLYITKGGDRTMIGITSDDGADEIKNYVDMRSYGAIEAAYRLFGFNLNHRHPAVMTLRVHLEGHHTVLFNEGHAATALTGEGSSRTELTAFFEYNSHNPCCNVKYAEFPEKFVWCPRRKKWSPRKKYNGTIGRIVNVSPSSGDVFYLRMLLSHSHCAGKKSFDDLRYHENIIHATYQDVCRSLGLLQDDSEWDLLLTDTSNLFLGRKSREVFVVLLLFCQLSDPLALFEKHYIFWLDEPPRNGDDMTVFRSTVLIDLKERLQYHGKTLTDFGLPTPNVIDAEVVHEESNHFVREHLLLNCDSLAEFFQSGLMQLNTEQNRFVHEVFQSLNRPVGSSFFLDARGGTGKTFTLNVLLAGARSAFNAISIAVASSGIAATLLCGGRTVHSVFKAPLDIHETSSFNLPVQSKEADLIRRSSLIVWDEAPMAHKNLLDGLDRCLKDVMDNLLPFGGKTVVLAGDFRQILPVVKNGSRAEVVEATIKRSHLWSCFQTFSLSRNMRLALRDDAEPSDFDGWLRQVGDGIEMLHDNGETIIPPGLTIFTGPNYDLTLKRVIEWTFEGQFGSSNGTDLHQRVILAPTNKIVDDLNNSVVQEVEGGEYCLNSADNVIDGADTNRFPVEFLNSLNQNGMPPHQLNLKTGVPVILLRNLNPREGLCNGARLIVRSVHHQRLIEATLIDGQSNSKTVFIPRIKLTAKVEESMGIEWSRRQFPVRVAFALTINKSQGQTFRRVAVFLPDPVFTHGQLYVALSRASDPDQLKVFLPYRSAQNSPSTKNVVYKEVLT